MITVEGLSKEFTRTVKGEKKKSKKESFLAVKEISFQVEKGEIFGVLGPNGAGKTTLLRMLGGILTPTSGSIEVANISYEENRNEVKKYIGYLSGNTKLYGRISPRELLSLCGHLYEMKEEEITAATNHIFKTLDMEEFADNRIEKLSTGQTQRTSIARCLVHSPELYIFDEPTLGLDVMSSHAIIEFMRKERDRGKTVLYSTHYMEEAETLCDRILMIHKGEIIALGTTQALKEQTGTTNLRDTFIQLVKERGELDEK